MAMKLRAPGWYRATLYIGLGVAFALALIVVARLGYGLDPVIDVRSWLLVSLLAVPLFFLGGLGAFDTWFHWASGRPTRPDDHSQHGATSWRSYFAINTDHKVI
nr:cytochrome c oxidase subunit I [Solirubrobacterales bacterium]